MFQHQYCSGQTFGKKIENTISKWSNLVNKFHIRSVDESALKASVSFMDSNIVRYVSLLFDLLSSYHNLQLC